MGDLKKYKGLRAYLSYGVNDACESFNVVSLCAEIPKPAVALLGDLGSLYEYETWPAFGKAAVSCQGQL